MRHRGAGDAAADHRDEGRAVENTREARYALFVKYPSLAETILGAAAQDPAAAVALAARADGPRDCDPRAALAALGVEIASTALWPWPFTDGVDYLVVATVAGGGIAGQAGAVRHGISRALLKFDANLRPALKKEGFLTRDPREVERKKPGLHRARRAPQFSKR